MPISECDNCGNTYQWLWEEAFDKFGFNDGDGQVETYEVEDVLREAGYAVEMQQWGLHNLVISSIKKDGDELMPLDDPKFDLGYSDPRSYLPEEIVQLLDRKLPANGEN